MANSTFDSRTQISREPDSRFFDLSFITTSLLASLR